MTYTYIQKRENDYRSSRILIIPIPIIIIGRIKIKKRKIVASSISIMKRKYFINDLKLLVFISTSIVFLANSNKDSDSVYSSIKRDRKLQ
jgi:hypothetical protein